MKKLGFKLVTALACTAALPGIAQATSFTSQQIDSAKAGLEDLRELNVFTKGNLNENNHVAGTTFVGGSLNGQCASAFCTTGATGGTSSATFGQGDNPASSATSTRPTLAVTGSTNTSFTMQSGQNGANGSFSKTVDIGGNLTVTQNVSPDGWAMRVGGNIAPIGNVNSGPAITYGGTYTGNTGNGRITQDASLASATTGLAISLASQRDTMVSDLTNLSSVLSSLSNTGTASVSGADIGLSFTNTSLGYNAITVSADTLFSAGSAGNARNLAITFSGSTTPLVINVVGNGGTYYDNLNMNFADALASGVIFNLVNIGGLSVDAAVKGSLLGLGTTVMNSSNIYGSVAVNILDQNAEIHLATYSGGDVIVSAAQVAAVPEPATWGLMLLGFGTIGYALRRERKPRAGRANGFVTRWADGLE